MKHQDSGCRCCVAHWRNGILLPACTKCSTCGQWIAFDKMHEDCQGPQPAMITEIDLGTGKVTKTPWNLEETEAEIKATLDK